jgi:sugar (pentulose or hexulose) kinase
MFGLPAKIFTPIQQPGAVRGYLLPELAGEARLNRAPVIAVGSHDTASAVAAVPAGDNEDFAYISSGTWSLLGAEIDKPLSAPEVMAANYTNEGGVCGKTRLLKNIMGLWILQELKREWELEAGGAPSFDELMGLAEAAEPFRSIIDVDDAVFLPPGGMAGRIRDYCRATAQREPATRGEFTRAVYESLALKYRWGVERLEVDLLGRPVKALHIVGGGSKDEMLNRFTASALGRPVIAGPSEATAIGNLLVQAMALGAISSLPHLRRVVSASFPTRAFEPEGDTAEWDRAYGRLLKYIEKPEGA